jgi:hypothetical protein
MPNRALFIASLVLVSCGAPSDVDSASDMDGVAVDDLSDCAKECFAFGTAGCAGICDQCNPPNGDPQVALAGAYVTDCETAERLACGGATELKACVQDTCGGIYDGTH